MTDSTTTPSQERLLDAQEIEQVASTMTRPTARMQLESLAKKLQKEAQALRQIEKANAMQEEKQEAVVVEEAMQVEDTPARLSEPAGTPAPVANSSVSYIPIDKFSFDLGGSSEKFVTLYIDLPGVGLIPKENISCQFGKDSVDLVVKDLKGKNYRLVKDQFEKDIEPEKSTYKVKANKILVKLHKCKMAGEYSTGFDYWTKLTDPKKKDKSKTKTDPSAGIMDLMKEMYDSGDDKMRKMIGETMLKQREGKLDDPMKSAGAGMGDLGDLNAMDDEDL